MSANFSEDMRKVFMAGVGALTGAVEKTGEIVDHVVKNGVIPDQYRDTMDELARKGENVVSEGVKRTCEVRDKVAGAVNKALRPDAQAILEALDGLDGEQLAKIIQRAGDILQSRASAADCGCNCEHGGEPSGADCGCEHGGEDCNCEHGGADCGCEHSGADCGCAGEGEDKGNESGR